jgi:glycine/D-amino acid oxidase-like deaminating enzyme
MPAKRRVIVIGGGAVGGCAALFLAQSSSELDITVVERDFTYARASSALSAGSVRQQFSLPVNIAMSLFGHAFLTALPDVGLISGGYLFLASAAGADVLRANYVQQAALGAQVSLLQPQVLASQYPWMNTQDIALASYGTANEGWFDGYALAQSLRKQNIARGVQMRQGEIVALRMAGGRVAAAVFADGSELAGDVFINAAGPWAASLAAMAGIDLPVRARRRTVFVVSSPTPIAPCPMVIDTSSLWFRPEGTHFICGISPADDEADPDDLPLQPDLHLFDSHIWPRMAHRVPAFEALRVERAWAGYYEVNTLDHNAIIGLHPACSNLYFANGFSGHGLQHAPAAGRGLAELITAGSFQTLDLSPLRFDRILKNAPLLERNII